MNTKFITAAIWTVKNWKSIKSTTLDIIGDIRMSKFPMFLLYTPDDYNIHGADIEDIQKKLQPGDIILRGYSNKWFDSLFIPSWKGFTHAGIYVGDNTVVHAVSPAATSTHLIDFCQADRIAVFRPNDDPLLAVEKAKRYIGTPYDYGFKSGDEALYCFELAAECHTVRIEKQNLSLFGKQLPKCFGQCYLDSSFYGSPDMQLIGEWGI